MEVVLTVAVVILLLLILVLLRFVTVPVKSEDGEVDRSSDDGDLLSTR